MNIQTFIFLYKITHSYRLFFFCKKKSRKYTHRHTSAIISGASADYDNFKSWHPLNDTSLTHRIIDSCYCNCCGCYCYTNKQKIIIR